jgi:hypothetical protein
VLEALDEGNGHRMQRDDDILPADEYYHVPHSTSNAPKHYKYPHTQAYTLGVFKWQVPQQWHQQGYTAVASPVERLHA